MILTLITALLVVVLVKYIFLRALLDSTQDVREPACVDLWFPFISPILRMGWTGFHYYDKHRNLPIYTIRLPGMRLYVINSTSLISAIQYNSRVFSFSPFLARAASNLIDASKSGIEVLSDDSENGFIKRHREFNNSSLLSGASFESLQSCYWFRLTSVHSHDFVSPPRSARMYEWVTSQVIMSFTDAIYGSQNPFQHSEARLAWKKYESGMVGLMAGLLPSITSREALHARASLVQFFQQYYEAKGQDDEHASAFAKDQYNLFSGSGMSDPDIARTQAAFSLALLGNIPSATFWLLYHIFSNREILSDCRREILSALHKRHDGGFSFDPSSAGRSCPILASTIKETLRTHSMGTSVTQVIEDRVIGGKYLLKKDAIVLIPAVIQNNDKSSWGENANEFDHLRFIRDNEKRTKRWNPAALRIFGGGTSLCPGRNLAKSMIAAFAASVIVNFEITPKDSYWTTPTVRKSNMGAIINHPDEDIDVQICGAACGDGKGLRGFVDLKCQYTYLNVKA